MKMRRLKRSTLAIIGMARIYLLAWIAFVALCMVCLWFLSFVKQYVSDYIENNGIMCGISPPNSSNVIVFLVSENDFPDLARRLTQLDARFLDNCSSKILLLHTGFPFVSDIAQLVKATRRHVIFRNVDHQFTSFPVGFDPYKNEPTFSKRGKWNYHHMIRFWFKFIFEVEEIQQFEYVMRLDTDSRIIGKWFNVFELMKVRRSVYFANEEKQEQEEALPGTMKLRNFFFNYQSHKRLRFQNPEKVRSAFTLDGIRTYYNNFEVFETKFFRRHDVRTWIDAIDESHGIYKYRWGDAILRYLTLALFAKDSQVLHRTQLNLSYCHPC
jgi:hypothetical protein